MYIILATIAKISSACHQSYVKTSGDGKWENRLLSS